jgi:1,2-dihydroxy-3-keto-5-methylthiopentene dioxygenase
MSELRVYPESSNRVAATYSRFEDIARELKAAGVLFERWTADRDLHPEATQDEVIEAYREPIDRLMQMHGFKSVDVISMQPDHPQKEALRDKFLHEHTHTEFEVRFFVDGEGLFYIHRDGKVYGVRCTRGDLISVPAGYTHWFDMGPQPFLKAIRLFTTPEGWVAQYTGNKIADGFPRLDALPSAA